MPINVQSATEDHSIRFHQYHLEDMGRVRVTKVRDPEDREVIHSEIGKGYEYARDQVVPSSDAELRELPLPTKKATAKKTTKKAAGQEGGREEDDRSEA